jgi:prepilin-type N-terminal cleavage/methylation domain-containing protein
MIDMTPRRAATAAFTLTEMMVALGVAVVVSALAYAYLRTGTLLVAKNVSMNLSNNDLRGSIDQIADRLQSAVNIPVLVNTSGAASASPAAGVYFDRLLGDPYIVTHPGGSGLGSSATTLTITRSTSAYASPPIPQAGDVLLIDGAPSTLRPRVSTATIAGASGGLQSLSITLTAALGTAIPWDATQAKTSKLVRREALIVMPGNPRPSLRRYHSFETTTDLTDATKFAVVSREVGNQGAELTPFSLVTAGLDTLLNIDFRVRAIGFDNVMSGREINGFSNYMRVQSMVPSRQRPKN